MPAPQLVFLAGIPASGKSHFGNWLEKTQGYLHIDAELRGELGRLGLYDAWHDAIRTQDCARFATAVLAQQRPAILNWGLPVQYLPIAGALKRAGFSAWWFDADIAAARSVYGRTGKALQDFDYQIAAIEYARRSINEMFAPDILSTINTSGEHLSPESIFAAICNSPLR